MDAGGGISLRSDDRHTSIGISIYDKVWTHYESADTLFCEAGGDLIIELVSGGFNSSSMLVDLIEIYKVE